MASALELCDVSVTFRTSDGNLSVLKRLSLQIEEHSWTTIVGANGSGKSTLGRVIAGLCDVSSGSIHAYAGRVQMVFQNPDAQLVGQTVYEDLSFGLESCSVPYEEWATRAESALAEVGLSHLLHTEVSHLSGGQKQLLCIASALCLQPRILVFDESTAMLDPLARTHILQVAQRIHQAGTTIVWITQWMEEVTPANRVLALRDGTIVFDGLPADFFYGIQHKTDTSIANGCSKTPCEELGFTLPYAVQLTQSLRKKGVSINGTLLKVSDIAEAVMAR